MSGVSSPNLPTQMPKVPERLFWTQNALVQLQNQFHKFVDFSSTFEVISDDLLTQKTYIFFSAVGSLLRPIFRSKSELDLLLNWSVSLKIRAPTQAKRWYSATLGVRIFAKRSSKVERSVVSEPYQNQRNLAKKRDGKRVAFLGLILENCWDPDWPQRAQKSILKSSWHRMLFGKTRFNWQVRNQFHFKSTPGASKRAPWAPKRVPRASQEHPKRVQETPKSAPRVAKTRMCLYICVCIRPYARRCYVYAYVCLFRHV